VRGCEEHGLERAPLFSGIREEVGFFAESVTRILRFQRAVQQLHAGVELPWAEMALDCGYYDQSHFANEFRAFSASTPRLIPRSERAGRTHSDKLVATISDFPSLARRPHSMINV